MLALALGLAMDAVAVSLTTGFLAREVKPHGALRVALFFGGAQAAMPALGALVGSRFASRIAAYDHWVAFGLLAFVGGKMIYEGLSHGDEERPAHEPFAFATLAPLAVATSIDALAVGLTLPVLHAPVGATVTVIGAVTAVLSAAGVYLGRRFGDRFGSRLDVIGGVVLVGIGLRILVAHLRGEA